MVGKTCPTIAAVARTGGAVVAPPSGPPLGAPRTRPRLVTVAALLVGVLVAFWRAYGRIADPTLWGEDGLVFLKGAREDGLASLLDPFVGYLHTLPRLLALALLPFPLTWQPGLYAATGAVVGLAIAALALSPRLAWLLPEPWQRGLLFVLLVAAPARVEVTANLANLIFLGALGMLLLALGDDPWTRAGRVAETVAMALLALSGPLALMVLPVLLARVARLRSRHSVVAAVAAAGAAVQWALLAADPRVSERAGSAANAWRVAEHRLLPAWLVGDTGVIGAWQQHRLALVAGCVALAVLLAVTLTVAVPRGTALALVATAALAVAVPALNYRRMALPPVAQRHLVLPLAVVTLLAVAALGSRWLALRAAAALLLATSLIGITADFSFHPLPELPIGTTAACLEQHRTPCPLPVNPLGWRTVTLTR
jgi:hypothetical protein